MILKYNFQRAQSILEFSVATIVFLMLAWGMVKIMAWSGDQLSRGGCQPTGAVENDCPMPSGDLQATKTGQIRN